MITKVEKMECKYWTIGICIGLFLVVFIMVEVFYDEEAEYQNALGKINSYKNICESAGFIFEVDGHLMSPEEQKEECYSSWNSVTLYCYELRNNVKAYHNLKMVKKIKYESPTGELERLKWENAKLQEELIETSEKLRNHNPAIICPICKKRVKSTDSRVKIVEFVRIPKKSSWESGAWKSRTLNNFHPKCWKIHNKSEDLRTKK